MIGKLLFILKSLLRHLSGKDRYHPERHYMRGPGPKARAAASQSRG